MRVFFLSICLLAFYNLRSEIEMVSFTWDNVLCREDCAMRIEKELHKIHDVAEVSVSQRDGMAKMRWDADKPFDFSPIRQAIKRVGIHVQTLKVTVTGTIEKKNNKFYIVSIGDATKFNLMGVAVDEPGKNRYVIQNSRYNRPLSARQVEILTEAMHEKKIVTIHGPIYSPYQFPPLDLIIESLSVSELKSSGNN